MPSILFRVIMCRCISAIWYSNYVLTFYNNALTTHIRHSIAQAITTFKEPYAVLVDASGQIEDYATSTCQSRSTFAHILRDFRVLNLDRSLLKIIFTITVFIADLANWYETGICPVDSLDLQKHASLLMFRLFAWYQHSEQDCLSENNFAKSVDQSVCLALLICMVNATEPNAASFGPRLHKAVIKLRLSLKRVPMVRWSNVPNLLFWVLTMGALGSRSLPKVHRSTGTEAEMSFFREYIKCLFTGEMCSHTTSAEQLLTRMRTCLWIPSVFDERVKSIWVLMGLCGANEMELDDISSSEGELVIEDEYALGQSTTLRFFSANKGKSRKISFLQ